MAIQRFGSGLGDDFMPHNFSTMLDRFFNESVQSRRRITDFTPQVDVCEASSGFELEVALPGMRKEDVKIEFQDGRLTISGERRFENANHDRQYHLMESQYGAFTRSFQFPKNVNPEAISAEFKDGILRVMVPKDEQKVKKHQIQIKGSDQQPAGQQQVPENSYHPFEEQQVPVEAGQAKRAGKSKTQKV